VSQKKNNSIFFLRSNRGSIVSYLKKHEAKNLLGEDERIIAKGANKLKRKSPHTPVAVFWKNFKCRNPDPTPRPAPVVDHLWFNQ